MSDNFYVQVKEKSTNKVVIEHGAMCERKAIKLADAIDIELSEEFYTEVVEK